MPFCASISSASINLLSQDCTTQDLSNTSWAWAKLRLLDNPLWQSIAAASIRTITYFQAQHLANTAWAVAQRKICNHPLRDSIASSALPRIRLFETRHIANTSWSLSPLPFADGPFIHALASASIPLSSHFEPCELANSAWSYAELGCRDEPLWASLSSSARPRWHLLDLQGVAALVDAGIPGLSLPMREVLDTAVRRLVAAAPNEAADWLVVGRLFLFSFGVDNLGSYGTMQLLRAWHIDSIMLSHAEGEEACHFMGKALTAHARAAQSLGSARTDSTEWASLELSVGQDEPDSWVAFSGSGRLDTLSRPPLRAFPLALNPAVDRSACAEFQLLARAASRLDGSSCGYAHLYCSGTPCLSCAAAMRQFQLLFPGVHLTFGSGRRQFVHGALDRRM